MGSQVDTRDEITVLVTGFGPFREGYPVNPSWEIARGLPDYLPPLRAKDPASRHGAEAGLGFGTGPVDVPEVRIRTHPEAIHVGYKAVRALVPKLWEPSSDDTTPRDGRRPDIVIHIGMASPGSVYQIERRGHRTGYHAPDVDGEILEDESGNDETRHGPSWVWFGLPDVLETDLDVPDVWTRWRHHSAKDLDLRISDDAGHYLCDFIYYSSLAHQYKAQRARKVIFFHVPADASDAAVARGRDLAVNLIRAIVESEVAARQREKSRSGGEL